LSCLNKAEEKFGLIVGRQKIIIGLRLSIRTAIAKNFCGSFPNRIPTLKGGPSGTVNVCNIGQNGEPHPRVAHPHLNVSV
jgi:hypothetical protein